MPNKERNNEGCDATGDDSSNADDLINNKFTIPSFFSVFKR